MASNLRVDSIVPATGANVSIGTATGGVIIPGVLTYEDVTNVDSVGVVTARTDINLGDSIIHIGDTDTKIRFPEADTLTVETNGAERIRIQSNGNTGIGTITAQNNARLQVSTNQQVVAAFEGTGVSDPQIYLGDDMTTPTDNCIILGYDKADNRGYLTVGGDGDNVFTVKNGGDIEIGVGDLKFGTSGKGIDFSATSDASGMTSELLDDYEEGTFSPIPDAGGGVTFTYAYNNGWYQKVGNTVTFQIYLMFYASSISGGNSGNGVAIQGLPYTIKNNDRYNPAFTIGRTYNFDINSDQRLYSYGDHNSTNIRMIVETDDTVGSVLTAGQVNQSTCLTFITGTYQI